MVLEIELITQPLNEPVVLYAVFLYSLCRISPVKLSVKSFKVPKLLIEVHESTIGGSLKVLIKHPNLFFFFG